MSNRRQQSSRRYPRVARVNELCREILAEELERIDDERLELVTITNVAVDPDLSRAMVDFTSLGEGEDEARSALGDHRPRLQRAIARQTRFKRTPELDFRVDQAIEYGARIERIIAENRRPDDDEV